MSQSRPKPLQKITAARGVQPGTLNSTAQNAEQKYHFVGWGLGVPGLPHVISFAEAEKIGAGAVELLKAAIANGNYAPLEAVKEE